MVRNITVEGFDVGVKTPGMPSSCAFENITLKGQKVVGFENHLPVSVRGLVSENKVPAVRNRGGLAQFVLIDGELTGGSPDACAMESDGSHYLRNVRSSGYKAALKADGEVVPGAAIDEAVGGRSEALFGAAAVAGLRIPQDLSVASFLADPWIGNETRPTSMIVPNEALGIRAIEMLLERIERPAEPLPAEVLALWFKEGCSTAPPQGEQA
jgi:hypothetical protein